MRFAILPLLFALGALGQERPKEEEIFGSSQPDQSPERPKEEDIFGTQPAQAPQQPAEPAQRLEEKAAVEPTKIGGLVYLRSTVSARDGQPPGDWYLSAPSLVDLYLDSRPNDRVRAFILGRMFWDPTVNPGPGGPFGLSANGGPTVVLDQLWVSFDISRMAFVTAGRQHVKWGTGRFWNPTDYLHTVRRDPLALFDSRTGTAMLKLHLPWEKRGWNFYGFALLEGTVQAGTQSDTGAPTGALGNADQLGKVAGAARAELVVGSAEFGLDVISKKGSTKGGVDFSAGVWDLDVYGEAALKTGSDVPLYEQIGDPRDYVSGYQLRRVSGFTPAVTTGASWSYKYNDEDTFTLGGEYFYNANGYDDPTIYPYLLLQQYLTGAPAFSPFYLGKHYAGIYFLLPKPGRWNDTTITFSTLGNLSDRSFLSRVDWVVTVLTYLHVEAYGQVHYGREGGEFRFGVDLPPIAVGSQTSPPIHLAPPTFDLGLNLRVGI
jgi:hypothetical protein